MGGPVRLDPAGYRRAPWKNGGGVTVDIAGASLPGAEPGAWAGMLWRLSRTRIEAAGPFSDLSGYDRILTVVEGSGVTLRAPGRPAIEARPFVPVRFPGEWPIASEPEPGGVGVLNLITARERFEADVAIVTEPTLLEIWADVLILHAPAGRVALSVAGERHRLERDEALRLDGAGTVTIGLEAGVLAAACVRERRGGGAAPG